MYDELCGQIFKALGASGCAIRGAERRSNECCTKVAECLDPPFIPIVIRLQYTSHLHHLCWLVTVACCGNSLRSV